MDTVAVNILSVVVITKNEAKNVGKCLESLLGVADDIVVVDSYSTDDTEMICKRYPVRFMQRTWAGYAETKNWANEQAASDWILSIDADEALSPELRASINLIKKEQPGAFCSFARLTWYCGKWIRHGGWYPDVKVRIFDRRYARWVGGFVHETLQYSSDIKCLKLKGDLLHYNFRSIDEHIEQVNAYSSLAAAERIARGEKASLGKLLLSPLFTFLKMYIFRLGFLDGWHGLVIAVNSAYVRFLRYAKMRLPNSDT